MSFFKTQFGQCHLMIQGAERSRKRTEDRGRENDLQEYLRKQQPKITGQLYSNDEMNGGRIYAPLQFEYCSHSLLSTQITGNFISIFISIILRQQELSKWQAKVLFKIRKCKEVDKKADFFFLLPHVK